MRKENIEESLKNELKCKEDYIVELEHTLDSYEVVINENKNDKNVLEATIRNKNDIITELENNFMNLENVKHLKHEIDQKRMKIHELEQKVNKLESEGISIEKLEEIMELSEEKDNRISELEDALRETIKLSTEREMVLHQEESKRKQIMEKVSRIVIFYFTKHRRDDAHFFKLT